MKGVTSDHESLSWSVVIIVTSYNMCEWGTILPHQQSMWLFVACTNSILFLLAQYCNFCLTQFPKSDFRVNQIAFPPYFLCYSFSCFNVLQLVVIFVLTSIKHRSLGFDSGYITLSVRVRRAQRLLRTTLPLNWVAGNTLLWQLPFAALGPRTAFHLLFLILLSVVSHSRSLSSPPSLFPFLTHPFVPLLASIHLVAALHLHSPFSFFFWNSCLYAALNSFILSLCL